MLQEKPWQLIAGQILKRCYKLKGIDTFCSPSTSEIIEQNLCAIQSPMDIRIVQAKLKANQYSNPKKFAQDMRKIWTICYSQLGQQNMISMYAKLLQQFFEQQYEEHLKSYYKKIKRIRAVKKVWKQVIWREEARKILKKCWNLRKSYFFHHPVDQAKFDIDDYFDIIKHPMDLSTIKGKLKRNIYTSFEQFANDMKLIWQNCYFYNGLKHQMSQYAYKIQLQFQQGYQQYWKILNDQ